jgi:oligoendopeptidase F
MSIRLRSEVPVSETWDLTHVYADEIAFTAAMESSRSEQNVVEEWIDKEIQTDSDLVALLKAQDGFLKATGDLGKYAFLHFAEDATSVDNQSRFAKARIFEAGVSELVGRVRTKLALIPAATLRQWIESSADLAGYSAYLHTIIESSGHRLSDDAEAVLTSISSFSKLPSDIYQTATGADITFASVKDSDDKDVSVTPFYMLMSIETSTDTLLRRRAYQSLTDGLRGHQHTLAKNLGAKIQQDVTLSRLRKYPSVFHMLQNDSSEASAPNFVGPDHFFMVQDLMMNELAPHMQRYARLRQRVLGLDRTLLCDVKAPLESLSLERVPFERAQEIITNAAKPLGGDYARILNRAFDERWVYRARNVGNLNGAFCMSTEGHPYVFSPFGEGLYDTFILGHELGHAVHGALSGENQPPTNLRSSRLFVEMPSTLMEHMIAHHLREATEDKSMLRKISMLQLLTFHHNFVTHQTEAEILRRIYGIADAGEPLTTGVFRRVSREVLAGFWGDAVTLDEGRIVLDASGSLLQRFIFIHLCGGPGGLHGAGSAHPQDRGRPGTVMGQSLEERERVFAA